LRRKIRPMKRITAPTRTMALPPVNHATMKLGFFGSTGVGGSTTTTGSRGGGSAAFRRRGASSGIGAVFDDGAVRRPDLEAR
jgi:hypothetical protein